MVISYILLCFYQFFCINIAQIYQICSLFIYNHLQNLFCFLSVFKIDFVSKYLAKTDYREGVYLHIFQKFFAQIAYYVSISHPRPHFQNQKNFIPPLPSLLPYFTKNHKNNKITINLQKIP